MSAIEQAMIRVRRWRDARIEDMLLEVLSRPECYDIDRLLLVTHRKDSILSPDGERIEVHRRAAGRYPRVRLAAIRLRAIPMSLPPTPNRIE